MVRDFSSINLRQESVMTEPRVVGLAHSTSPKPIIPPLDGVFPSAGAMRHKKMPSEPSREIREALYQKLMGCPEGTNFCRFDFPVGMIEEERRVVHSFLLGNGYSVKRESHGKSQWVTITF